MPEKPSRREVIAAAASTAVASVLPAAHVQAPYRIWTMPSWKHAQGTAEHYIEREDHPWGDLDWLEKGELDAIRSTWGQERQRRYRPPKKE
jgi:hypothetical protein